MSGEADSAFYYLDECRQQNPGQDWFVELSYLELMKGNKKQAEIYLDSCIQFNLPLIKEFQGMPNEYGYRINIAWVYALKGESRKAVEQAERVRKSLGDSLLTVRWSGGGILPQLCLFPHWTKRRGSAHAGISSEEQFYNPSLYKIAPLV